MPIGMNDLLLIGDGYTRTQTGSVRVQGPWKHRRASPTIAGRRMLRLLCRSPMP